MKIIAELPYAPAFSFPFTQSKYPPNWFERQRAMIIAQQARIEQLKRKRATNSMLDFTMLNCPNYDAGWVHHEIAAALDAFLQLVREKKRPRLMLNIPPRFGKSELVSRNFPAYILGHHPEMEVVIATGTQLLADEMGRDVRSNMLSPIYSELFPNTVLEGSSQAADHMRTTKRGGFRALSVGAQFVGFGAGILICDDLLSSAEAADSETQRESIWTWFTSVARNRLAPGGGIIMVQTRWSEDDPSGKICELEQKNPKADQYTKFVYPAIATQNEEHRKIGESLHPSRWPLDELEALKHSMPPRAWSALFMQQPVPAEGIVFRKEWVERIVPQEKVPKSLHSYVSVDTAISEKDQNAYNVIRQFHVDCRENIYFGKIQRLRCTPFELVEHIITSCKDCDAQYLAIEKTHVTQTIGPYMRQRFREEKCNVPIWEGVPTKDKYARSSSLRGRMEQQRIFFIDLPEHHEFVIHEYLAFPAGKYADIVDSDSWSCLMLDSLMSPAPPEEPEEEAPDGDSMAGMMKRCRTRNTARHVPERFTGHGRKSVLVDDEEGWG